MAAASGILFGTKVEFESANGGYNSISPMSNSTFVMSYRSSTDNLYGVARVGAVVSGASIVIGSQYAFTNVVDTRSECVIKLSEDKFMVVCHVISSGSAGLGIIGTISGTTISYGQLFQFNGTGNTSAPSIAMLTDSKVVISYRDGSDGGIGKAVIGSISGTTIVYGTEYEYSLGSDNNDNPIIRLDDSRFIVNYRDPGDSFYGKMRIGTVSGTTIAFGAVATYYSDAAVSYLDHDVISSGKLVLTHRNNTTGFAYCQIGTVSGTTLNFGPSVSANASSSDTWGKVSVIDADRFVFSYVDGSDSLHGTSEIGTIDGDVITFDDNDGDEYFSDGNNDSNDTAILSPTMFVVAYKNKTGSNAGEVIAGFIPVVIYEITSSGNLFTKGHLNSNTSGDLYITGHKVNPGPTLYDISFGEEEEFFSLDGAENISTTALDASGFVVAYRDTNNTHGKVEIGTVSGTTIIFGTDIEFNAQDTRAISTTAIDPSTFVVAYGDGVGPWYGNARVGTISGTNITFGAKEEFVSTSPGATYIATATLDSSTFVVAYQDINDSEHGTAKIGTITGTNITFGAEKEFLSTGTATVVALATLNSNKFVVTYRDGADSDHGTAKIGTVVGTTITFGNEAEFNSSGLTSSIAIAALNESKFIVVYRDNVDSSHGTAKIGTVTGTTITFGEETEFLIANGASFISVEVFDAFSFIITYQDLSDSNHGTAIVGTVSGTNITFGEEAEFLSEDGASYISVVTLDTSTFVVTYKDEVDSNHGTAKVGTILPVIPSNDLLINGFDEILVSEDMFIRGIVVASSAILDQTKSIDWLLRTQDHDPQIIGIFATTANIVTMQIFDSNASLVVLSDDSCYAIGDTGRWGWSTANLPSIRGNPKYYSYVMTSDAKETFGGQFTLDVPEGAKWSHPDNRSDYLR